MTEDIYGLLGKLTEQMYTSLAKEQTSRMQDELKQYYAITERKIADMINSMKECKAGELVSEYKKKLQIIYDNYLYMKEDIDSKYKIYLRGCGNSGKSTLLNALLSLDEKYGSRMGRLPKTFIIDIYTDEMSTSEASVRFIDMDGKGSYVKMSREKAICMEDDEEKRFAISKDKCNEEIKKRCENVFSQQEKEDIERDVYLNGLIRTDIREIKWGIGHNRFFHNCVLIDTPGLSQELRCTNVLEDIKDYEVDGIIWVISSEQMNNQEITDAYKEEMKELHSIYDGKKVIAVLNMYGDEYIYGNRQWMRAEKRARKIYCGEGGFDDIVCVNAKLAYEGDLSNSHESITNSNILELRKIINSMFVERTSVEYNYEKLEKIERFLNNLYKDSTEIEKNLKAKVDEYSDKSNKIISQVIASNNLVREDKNKVIKRHLVDIRKRINNSSQYINDFDEKDKQERDNFIKYNIVDIDKIQKDIKQSVDESAVKIYKRFCDLQVNSVMSSFKTVGYAIKYFEKYNTEISVNSNKNIPEFNYKMTGWDRTGNIITEIFGDNDITRFVGKIFKGIRNMIKSPQDRLYDSIKKELLEWVDTSELRDIILEYRTLCEKTLDKSMEQSCGSYEDVKKLIDTLSEFNADRPHIELKEVQLDELIGGA